MLIELSLGARVTLIYYPGNFLIYRKCRMIAVILLLDYIAPQKYLLFPVAKRTAAEFLAHAPSHNHLARYFCGNFQIVTGSG